MNGLMHGPALRGLMEAGRGGDDTIGHLDTGEIVVPTMVLGRAPKVRSALAEAFAKAGLDMTDFTVGSGDVNPKTGLQEFEGDGADSAGPDGGGPDGMGGGLGGGAGPGGNGQGGNGPGGNGQGPSAGLGTGNNPSNPSGHPGNGPVGSSPGANGVGGGSGGFAPGGLTGAMIDAWNADNPLAAFGFAAQNFNPAARAVSAFGWGMGKLGAEPTTPDGQMGPNAVGGMGPSGGADGMDGIMGGDVPVPTPAPPSAVPVVSNPAVPGRVARGPVQQPYWDGNRFVIPGLPGLIG
jgi:hypothetical protein